MNGKRTMKKKIISIVLGLSLIMQSLSGHIILATEPGEVMVNDSEFTYSSGWYYSSNRKNELNLPLMDVYNKDVHANNQAGAWAEYTFTGSKLTIYGEKNTDGGTAKVELYKGNETTPSYTRSISCHGSTRSGYQELCTMDLSQGTYRMRITLDGSNYVVLDAIQYVDTSNFEKNLNVTGLQQIDTLNARGTYSIIENGAATDVIETQNMSVKIKNTVDIPLGDTLVLKNGSTILATQKVFSAGDIIIHYAMPKTDVVLSLEAKPIPVTPTTIWVEDALEKVPSNKEKPANASTQISLEMAKNEYEGAQIVVKDDIELYISAIEFSDLQTSAGERISKEHLSYNFVDYRAIAPVGDNVKGPVVEDGSNGNVSVPYRPEVLYPKDGGHTILPDPLSNEVTRKVTHTQPIFITVHTLKDTVAGDYLGTITLKTSKNDITVPIQVKVHNVTIADAKDSSYTIYNWASEVGYSFQHTLDSPKIYYGLDDRYTADWWTVIDNWTDKMIAHRQNMYLLNTPQLLIDGGTTISADGTVTFNWSKFDEFIEKLIDKGFTQFGGMHLLFHWNGVNPEGYAGQGRGRSGILERNGADDNIIYRGYYADDPRTTRFYEQYFEELAKHLDTLYIDASKNITVLDRWYQHVFDEPKYAPSGGADWKIIAQLLKKHAVVKDSNGTIIKRMKASDADASGILKNNASLVDRWVPDLKDYHNDKSYYDNLIASGSDVAFYICVSPAAPYLNRFTTQENITGVLLSWYAQNNNISSILHWGFNTWSYSAKTAPGDAQIVYPDKERLDLKGSLRFEAMRDGIEDYEILETVASIDANKADLLVDNMITTANDYSMDLSRYRNMRSLALRIASGESNIVVPDLNSQVTDGKYNNNHRSISYVGNWKSSSNRPYNDYKKDASYTTDLNAYTEFSFEGTGIRFITERNSDMGSYEIFIDDISQGTITSYTSGSRETQVTTFEKLDLTNGSHRIKIVNKEAGKYLLVDAFQVVKTVTPSTTKYNNTSSTINYTGNWMSDSNRPFGDYKDDASYSTALDAYVELTFNGTGIKFITERNHDMGSYEIFIDDISQGTITSYTSGSRETQVTTFEKLDLTNGSHRIKIVNKEAGKYLLVDAFEVIH